MSRCFQFPPPGYVWHVGGESLVELLKLRREGALACKKKKMMKKRQRSSRKEKGKSSDERKRFNRGKRDQLKERKCEATATWWSEIRCLSEELEWLSSRNRFTSYRDHNQNISNMFINNGSDECKSELNLPETKHQMDQFSGSSCRDTGFIPSNELCYSPSESSCLWESQAESWVPPPTPEIEYGDLDDLNWLVKTSSHGKSNLKFPNQPKAVADDHIHTPADKFLRYPSARYLPEAGIYALPYTTVV